MTAALLTRLGLALGCPGPQLVESGDRSDTIVSKRSKAPALPAALYCHDGDIRVSWTRPAVEHTSAMLTSMEREARELAREGDERLKRFFAGRYSARRRRMERLR